MPPYPFYLTGLLLTPHRFMLEAWNQGHRKHISVKIDQSCEVNNKTVRQWNIEYYSLGGLLYYSNQRRDTYFDVVKSFNDIQAQILTNANTMDMQLQCKCIRKMRLRSKSVKFTGEQRNHHCYKERTLSAVAEFSHISPGPVSRVILHKAYRGAGPTL